MSLPKKTEKAAFPNGERDLKLTTFINLKLSALGCPIVANRADTSFQEMAAALLSHYRETHRLLAHYLCPADRRIQDFLDRYLADAGGAPALPGRTFILDYPGLARELSLPFEGDHFSSDIINSYRVKQGVLHNPKSDRRTTEGIFHVTEGGLPIPDDKRSVPKEVFGNLLRLALAPPRDLMRLPFSYGQESAAECFVSLHLRPLVCPRVPGYTAEKSMEIRFFAPGGLVSNLDFVERIFGNAGDPFLPENDAALDAEHWTGHSGCVILAPHLIGVTKKEVGLPCWETATENQRRDHMCWKSEEERYNDGTAFKLTCRDQSGVIVTLIADNYFGYCKKEVKTQISYAANLFGSCEEEHAGGAIVYPSYDLGEEFSGHLHVRRMGHTFGEVVSLYGERMESNPEGYAIDKQFPEIVYVSEDALFDLHNQRVSWLQNGVEKSIKLLAGKTYIRPSGYKVRMEKLPGSRTWRLVGTVAEGTLCHKPCTVSGGGKSEISKAITDAVLHGPVFVADFKCEFDLVSKITRRDFSDRFRDKERVDNRPLLSPERSLGSVIKLLTPALRDYTDEYNEWLQAIPQYVRELVFVVKRFFRPSWGEEWRAHFSVDVINGTPGNELKCDNRLLVENYLRVGYEPDGSWRVFGLRQDFHPASKLPVEDDITASVIVPSAALEGLDPDHSNPSVKFVQNCENRLFQRPDEAIHRGYDKRTEADLSQPGNFLSNYEPLTAAQAKEMVEDNIRFDQYTAPMQTMIREVAETGKPAFFVSSAHPRLVDGKPSKNPRYLQVRSELLRPQDRYLVEMAARLHRRIPLDKPIHTPVNAVLPGRRNNPPGAAGRIRALAVYNPIHYMELPELLMEYICSLTGKSPSTTGAGSEGALTKGPFNALPPIVDLNNALVGHLLTGYNGFVTAAGYVGPHARVDHDISLLIPEVWCRMTVQERDPKYLIDGGYLERCEDFQQDGQKVMSSRLGYRITRRFVRTFFGRIFNHPHLIFSEKMLRPETQDWEIFVDGMENIVTTQKRVAEGYVRDGSIDNACPPLKAILTIMIHNEYEGKGLQHPEIRALFTRESLVNSNWYQKRLTTKQAGDQRLWERHTNYLEAFLSKSGYSDEAERMGIPARLSHARATLDRVKSPAYIEHLQGSLGADPLCAAAGG
ncbi:MAG: hypothetical protein O2960_05235 [Verrucomicrobia bacterium]|nr:hypothetical protein [Verrucomicrobiota bacterium]